MKNTKDKSVVLKEEASPAVKEAQKIVIKDVKGMTVATEVLSNLNKHLDAITKEKEKVTKPLNEALKAERGRWKPIETELETAIANVRGKMSDYQTAEMKRAREEEAKIAARVERGTLKMETGVKKMEEIERVDEKVETTAGSISFREDKVLKITNESLIPEKYWLIDDVMLLNDLKKGLEVPGAEIDIKMVPLNRRG